MKHSLVGALMSVSFLLGGEAHALAQSTVTDIVSFLVTNQSIRTGDAASDRAAAEAARDTITRALLVNLTSVPIATSSSGFLYRLNPELGTVERATQSFGGFFVERAFSPGHGRATVGVSASTSSFDRLNNEDLRDGKFLTTANRFIDEPAPFETETLTLEVRSSTMTAYASVGITDRVELGAAVPFVRLEVEGQRVSVYRGQTFLQASGSATASGVADAALRAKYTFVSAHEGGAAIAGEVRLPTGNAENLLGAGDVGVRIFGIASLEHGPLMLTGNAGIVRGGVSAEFNTGVAAAVAVHPRLSLTGEFLARRIDELRPLVRVAQPHPTIDKVQTIRLGTEGEEASGGTVAAGITGFKWNPTSTLVIGAHIRWAFTTSGLTAPLTPSVGVEYGF
jgi:hypothetical protein